ncbi:MAG: thioesterase family protein [Thermoplasmata archaeon]|jgi:predicted thioesterase|nr:thioesterase family protein [Thermoplasmata archaeon]MVT15030.1 hypothetical protein [Euryarchaeota archaeon]
MEIKEGMEFEKEFSTTKEHSAKNVGSGDVEVLSTPSLISFIENTAREPLDSSFGNDMVTVGTLINIRHLRASKIGDSVIVKVKLLSMDGNRFTFWAEAFCNGKKIASGIHERTLVKRSEFLNSLKNVKE